MMRYVLLLIGCFWVLVILNAGTEGVAQAQEDSYPPMAAFGSDGNVWLYGFEDEPVQVTDDGEGIGEILWHPSGSSIADLVWSPDGTLLALAFSLDDIKLYDVGKRKLGTLKLRNLWQWPIAFDMSGKYLLFASGAERIYEDDWGDYFKIEVGRSALESNRPPEIVATVGVEYSLYGGGPESPADISVRTERGARWQTGDRILADTPFGLLSSSGLVDPEAIGFPDIPSSITLHNAVTGAGVGPQPVNNAVLSLDKGRIATMRDGNIIIIDLATQKQRIFNTQYSPELVAWGANDRIYYASTVPSRDLFAELSADEQEEFGEDEYLRDMGLMTDNKVFIHELDLSSGKERTIHEEQVYAIGKLMPSPDGKELFFSTIPNHLQQWIDVVLQRSEPHCSDCDLFVPSLWRLDLASGEVHLIETGLYKATINWPVYEQQYAHQ